MSSLKGRKVQSWIKTPLGCLDKTIAHILYRTFYEHGYRGKTLDDAVFAKFEHLRQTTDAPEQRHFSRHDHDD